MQKFTLTDGSKVALSELTFDANTYHVFAGSRDITNLMRQSDKVLAFPGFDRARDNIRASDEAAIARGDNPTTVGDTTIWGNFWHQIGTEPLKAPVEALMRSFRGFDPKTQTTLKVGVVLLGAGMILYGLKLVKDIKNG